MRDWQSVFSDSEREAQRRWGDPTVWDEARITRLLWQEIPARYHARIEKVPFFFLATSDGNGRCDCSFKGGGPGLVRIIDSRTLEFPDFDGNDAFMSVGNILANPHVGLLFIDFTDGARLRVNGRATIHDDAAPRVRFPQAKRIVRIRVEQVVPNCAAHVPRLIPAASDPEMPA